jgi:hypothetical protein
MPWRSVMNNPQGINREIPAKVLSFHGDFLYLYVSNFKNMADNYLEKQREQYEARKAAWLKKRKTMKKKPLTPAPASSSLHTPGGGDALQSLVDVDKSGDKE